jgi:TRAP transporter 4TM/12TM fusion protein
MALEIEEAAVQKERTLESMTTKRRNIYPFVRRVMMVLAVTSAVFHLYAASFLYLPPMQHNAVHLLFFFLLAFPSYRFSSRDNASGYESVPVIDWVMAILGGLICLYVVVGYYTILERSVEPSLFDKVMTVILILTIMEGTRRLTGFVLPLIASLFIVYAVLGPYFPGVLKHRGYDLVRLTSVFFLTQQGIWGAPMRASATMVYMFIIFGSFLLVSGGGKLLIDLSFSLSGWMTGGPAKVAVLASSALGTVSGSSGANVATTGQMTIPLMKQAGYTKEFAGAVEAAASTGGLLMPPIMGAGAFIMAEFLQVPYVKIIKAAVFPSLLFYGAVFTAIHFEALKMGMRGLPKESLPSLLNVLRERGLLLIPIIVLVALIIVAYPLMRAAFYSICLLVPIAMIRRLTRISPTRLFGAFESAAMAILPVTAACATAGIIIGVVNLTGMGLKLSVLLLGLAGGNIFLLLVLTMIVVILLGMGLPATPAYIIGATVCGPILVRAGIPPLVAHLYVFYFACMGAITPPVALTAYIAAGLSGASPTTTAYMASFLALPGFIVPYMFVASQSLLLQGGIVKIITSMFSAGVGVFAIGLSVAGYIMGRATMLERLLLLLIGLCFIKPGPITDLLGLLLLLAVLAMQYYRFVYNPKT